MSEQEGQEYWCPYCQKWLEEQRVLEYTDELYPDGEGPEICPECEHEVVWWTHPDAPLERA